MTIISGFESQTVTANGQQVHYARGGDGPPLLLMHGFPQTHAMWHAVAPALARHFTVVAPICAATAKAASRKAPRITAFAIWPPILWR